MRLREDITEIIVTDDFFYDLFERGLISPYETLVKQDADQVNAAIELINKYRALLEETEIMEYV